MSESLTLVREELYEKVWLTPVWKLCTEYRLSDRGLAKICARMEIPLPGRGYWQKLENGLQVEKKKLPKLSSSGLEQVIIHETVKRKPTEEVEKIVVPEDLDSSHEVVRLTRSKLWKTPAAAGPLLRSDDRTILNVQVTRKSLSRALRIMEAVIRAFEDRGVKVTVTEEGKTVAVCNEQTLSFSISETVERSEHIDRRGYKRYEYSGTGKLTLKSDDASRFKRRQTWADGKRQSLEQCLGDFVGVMIELGPLVAEWEKEWERKRRQWALEEELRRQEETRKDRLKSELSHWARAQEIRRYFGALQQQSPLSDELQKWIEWGFAYANELDPIPALIAGREPRKSYWEFNSRGNMYA